MTYKRLWYFTHGPVEGKLDALGMIPGFLDETDPRGAQLQFAARAPTGWSPQPGFTMSPTGALCYPGDPELPVMAFTYLNGQTVLVYEHAYVCIITYGMPLQVARLD